MEEKKTINYKELKMTELAKLYAELSEEEKKLFDPAEYIEEAVNSKMSLVLDRDGNPIKRVREDGKSYYLRERVKLDTQESEKYQRFNFYKAKSAFYKAFKDKYNWENAPGTKKEATDKKRQEAFELFGIEVKEKPNKKDKK